MSVLQDAPKRARALNPRVVAGSLFSFAIVVVAASAAWPIYRSAHLLLLVGVSVPLAALIAMLAWRRAWNGWIVAGLLAATFFVVGVPLAVPTRLGGFGEIVRGFGELASGAVLAWKDLVTVELPVGSYRNLLVPALVVFLVGTCLLLLLSWRADRIAYFAAPLAIAMTSFGLFFGRTTVSDPLRLGPVVLYAPWETLWGVSAFVATLAWLAWRTHDERVRALRRAAASSGVRMSRRPSRTDRRRTALGAGMVAASVAVAVAVVPIAAQGSDRDVLRASVGPDIDLAAEVSPLSEYRGLFSDDRADQVLFTVTSSGTLPSRVRIATLDSYDGEVFRASATGVDGGRFVRVPSALDPGPGTAVEATITVETWEGIWLPTAGRVESVQFTGARGATLADRFYYNADAAAGVETAGGGLTAGDAYVVHAVEPAARSLAEIAPRGGVDADVAAPESLRAWMAEHAEGTGGPALEGLVTLLRERGYLSHGLARGDEAPLWASELADYSPQPSASGHSLARIESLFARLLERENDPRAASTDNYVAAIGDDEQFAVAVALMARELGFPSRVVVGARLGAPDLDVASCENGVCRARDVAVWAEVQSSDGDWVAIDATPQYAKSPSLDVTELQDPKHVTEVRPDTAEQVLPPDPVQEDSATPAETDDDSGLDLAWLWPILRITAIVLLLLLLALGPFLVVIAAKAARRRGRRQAAEPATRIAGGWDEYVDAAVDAGREAPRSLTRQELAESFDTASGAVIATAADRAVFSAGATTDAEADEVWAVVSAERRALLAEKNAWKRLVATVSLRSFIRQLAPAPGARPRFAERGRRRTPTAARSTS